MAIIDSEFDTEHIELKPKLLQGKNYDSGTSRYRTTSVRANAEDIAAETLHGSHVAGLVAAVNGDNANGVVGAVFDCVVIPYKVSLRGGAPGTPQGSESKFVSDFSEALVDLATRPDVRVVSMSLGTDRLHPAMRDAVNLALANGKVLVASSGNGQQNNPGVQNYPASFPGVIAVAATQPDDNIAPFSTNGDFVDVAAPGDAMLSTWDSSIPGNAPGRRADPRGRVQGLSGTSMASPITPGSPPSCSCGPTSARRGEADPRAERRGPRRLGQDPVFGAGRINAFKTLQTRPRTSAPARRRTPARPSGSSGPASRARRTSPRAGGRSSASPCGRSSCARGGPRRRCAR